VIHSLRAPGIPESGDLGSGNPTVIGPEYERQADPVIDIQLAKARVRLASYWIRALHDAVSVAGGDYG
jgi:hypothetical protein